MITRTRLSTPITFSYSAKFPHPSRQTHQRASTRNIPLPTAFVPDTKTFLSLIGRGLSKHAAKIPNWESLFSLNSTQLRKLGIEPARTRRYLLWWREKFRNGLFGIGGDVQKVVDATAELRVVEVPHQTAPETSPATRVGLEPKSKLVVNSLRGASIDQKRAKELAGVKGMRVVGAHTISGSYVQLVKGSKGSVAKLTAQENMWEERRGHKVDGGERRKAEVRFKRRLEENRKRQ